MPSTDPQAGARAPRVLIAQASIPAKALAVAVLAVELAISILTPTLVIGVMLGVQVMVIREAFRKIKIVY